MTHKGHFFKDDDFEFSAQLALGAAYYGAADVGEVLATTSQIKSGDYDSWCREWTETAERIESAAEASEGSGHSVSAREAFLRASTYWFQVAFYVLGTKEGDPDRLIELWRRHRRCFERAAALFEPPFERVEIPYESDAMEGWFFPVDGSDTRRPLLLLNNGSDGTATDIYVQGAAAGLARGYNCLTFDGPGQNHSLYERGLYFRPDWEHVVTPVVDYALSRPDVDPDRIAILGVSQAGYWVARAVAFEQRIAAAILDPGVVDVGETMTSQLSGSMRKMLDRGEEEKFNRDTRMGERFSRSIRYTMDFRSFPYGTSSPFEFISRAREYKLEPDVIERIRCPVLITDPEGEQFWPGQSQQLHDALTGPKELVRFTAAEGADLHCEPKAAAVRTQRIFDWLDSSLSAA